MNFALIITREDGRGMAAAEVELYAPTTDRLLLDYARCPKRMITEKSIFEFPSEFVTAIYAKAKIIMYEKIEEETNIPMGNLYAIYDEELEKTKENLWSRGQSGGFQVEIDSGGDFIDTVSPGRNHWTPYHW